MTHGKLVGLLHERFITATRSFIKIAGYTKSSRTFTLSVCNLQLRNIGRAKCIVCPTNPTVGRATARVAHYVPVTMESRLHCLGHVFRMGHQRIPQQALYWQVSGYKRGPGRPRANWRGLVSKDLRKMRFTWEEAEVAALDRHGWRQSVGQCVQMGVG